MIGYQMLRRLMKKLLIFTALFFYLAQIGFSQTCCSGGVPLSAGLGLANEEEKTLQLQLHYDLNVLQILKTGTEVIEDDSRTRRTHSVLLQSAYNISKRFAAEVLFSWVQQDRLIQQFGDENLSRTSGLGDAALLLKFQIFSSPQEHTQLNIAVGSKVPLGPADLQQENGLSINADLQPGSGAWDGILWGQLIHKPRARPSMSFNATTVYSLKGSNHAYLGQQSYRFGNELQLMIGLSDRFFIGNSIIDPSLSIRYRSVKQDRLNQQSLPSTGGQWIFLNPGFSYWLSPSYALQTRFELPLYAKLTGTQLSPSYRLTIGLFAKISLAKNSLPLLH